MQRRRALARWPVNSSASVSSWRRNTRRAGRLQALQSDHEQLRVDHSTLQSSLEHRQRHFDEQQALLRKVASS